MSALQVLPDKRGTLHVGMCAARGTGGTGGTRLTMTMTMTPGDATEHVAATSSPWTVQERELHGQGYTLVDGVAPPHATDMPDADAFEPIFNCTDASLQVGHRRRKKRSSRARPRREVEGDSKRGQAQVHAHTRSWRLFRRQLTQRLAQVLPHHRVGTALTLGEAVVIKSEPGCQRQAAHTDHVPSLQLQRLVYGDPTRLPLAVLVAVEEGTTLEVWPSSIALSTRVTDAALPAAPLPHTTLKVPTGSAVVFRADLVHAGSAYAAQHRRLHLFLESAAFAREYNTTFIIHDSDPTLGASLQ